MIFCQNKIQKFAPNIVWNYDQLFKQKWNFFTQPNTYNDKLFFILKNEETNNITDSIDVIKLLWDEKKEASVFNTNADMLDHIIFRQLAKIRFSISLNQAGFDSIKKIDSDTLSSRGKILAADHFNLIAFKNLETFGKLILEKNGVKLKPTTQFKMKLYTNYIKEFSTNASTNKNAFEFETAYKHFN